MNVTLLSCGPSLSLYDGRGEIRIGINRAVSLYRCEWWAFGDIDTWNAVKPIGSPLILTEHNANKRIRRSGYAGFVKQFSELDGPMCTWRTFTATAALVLAVSFGAKQIDAFGVDMAGAIYFDGSQVGVATETRWDCERRLWAAVVKWCGEKNIRVVRHGYDCNCCRAWGQQAAPTQGDASVR